jgi:hypothetical protein
MKWLLLFLAVLLLYRTRRIRRGDFPAGDRFDFLIASAMLAVVGIAVTTVALKVGLAGMVVGLAGLGLVAGCLALGLMKLRR